MAEPILLRCRSKAGIHSITDLDTHSTLMDLKVFVLSCTGLPNCDKMVLKSGIPPTQITGGKSKS